MQNREVRIARALDGVPRAEDFVVMEAPVPMIGDGDLLVRTIYLVMTPGTRAMMPVAGGDAPAGPPASRHRRMEIGDRVTGGVAGVSQRWGAGSVGEVVESRHPDFAPGDFVTGGKDWQLYERVPGEHAHRLDPTMMPIEQELGLLGRSAFTGYYGYRVTSAPKTGETILISAASGAVGMIVAQLARADGLRVIGIAGGATKCRYLTEELGADAGIDRNTEDLAEAVDRLAPQGIDIYFDNAGGAARRVAFDRLRPFGRHIVCGMVADYGGSDVVDTLNISAILRKRLRIEGFVIFDHDAHHAAFVAEMSRHWAAGRVQFRQQVVEGLDSAPEALAACVSGGSSGGQILVRVSPDTSR